MYGDQGSRRLSNIRTGVDEQNPTVDEPTSPAHPIASYPPIIIDKDDLRPVSNAKGRRAAEFYGFVAWLLTLLVYIAYILWTVLPDEVIRATGIEWYPAREWAILFPAWSVMLFLTAYCVYLALGIYGTPALSSLSTITDSRAHYPAVYSGGENGVGKKFYQKFASPDAVPAPYDLPPALVNKVLYGMRRRSEALVKN